MKLTAQEIIAKPHIFAESNPERAVESALRDLGWDRDGSFMPHMATVEGRERFTIMFTTLIEKFVKRAEPKPKQVIELYYDPVGTRNGGIGSGCWRARLKNNHKIHDAGWSKDDALYGLLLLLPTHFNFSGKLEDYIVETLDTVETLYGGLRQAQKPWKLHPAKR
jgi:hypothetical protein